MFFFSIARSVKLSFSSGIDDLQCPRFLVDKRFNAYLKRFILYGFLRFAESHHVVISCRWNKYSTSPIPKTAQPTKTNTEKAMLSTGAVLLKF